MSKIEFSIIFNIDEIATFDSHHNLEELPLLEHKMVQKGAPEVGTETKQDQMAELYAGEELHKELLLGGL